MPKHIKEDLEANREWRRALRVLKAMGVLTVADGPALAVYCQAWSRWVQAEEAIRKTGILIRHRFTIAPNPAIAIARDAMDQMRRIMQEFGMTPASRTRIQVLLNQEAKDPLQEFLDGGHRN